VLGGPCPTERPTQAAQAGEGLGSSEKEAERGPNGSVYGVLL
jgi:hypothetical protein